MWNGMLSPFTTKHRDYLHATFAEHQLDNGATYTIQPPFVRLRFDPVDYTSQFVPSKKYYAVDFILDTNKSYRYMVPAEADGSMPNLDNIIATLNAYADNPIEGGRDWEDAIDLETTPLENLASLERSYAAIPAYNQPARF